MTDEQQCTYVCLVLLMWLRPSWKIFIQKTLMRVKGTLCSSDCDCFLILGKQTLLSVERR